jgi:hypothetical protein
MANKAARANATKGITRPATQTAPKGPPPKTPAPKQSK